MKYYIFITPTTKNIGGAELYLHAKYSNLLENGWNVFLFYGVYGQSILPLFKDNMNYISELRCMTSFFSKNQVNNVIDRIISTLDISRGSEIIVESTCIEQSTWGELLACRLGGKHIVFLLQEKNILSKDLLEFFLFKNNRGELAGIREKTIYDMFSEFMHNPPQNNKKLVAIGCADSVSDIDSQLVDELISKPADFTIGSIGRLDKSFVPIMIDAICTFCNTNKDKSFNIILIGGHPSSDIPKIYFNKINDIKNCKVIITGYIFPIPLKLIKLLDVCIATAGSANVSYINGIPTISVDAVDNMPIGIMGHTCTSNMFRKENEKPVDYQQILNELLIEKKYTRFEVKEYIKHDYSSHFEFIKFSSQKREYFNILKLKNSGRLRIHSIFVRLFGHEVHYKLSTFKNKLIK